MFMYACHVGICVSACSICVKARGKHQVGVVLCHSLPCSFKPGSLTESGGTIATVLESQAQEMLLTPMPELSLSAIMLQL